jgi:hypothetical protein
VLLVTFIQESLLYTEIMQWRLSWEKRFITGFGLEAGTTHGFACGCCSGASTDFSKGRKQAR